MKNITVRLDEDMIAELEAEADEHGKTRSEHIRDTLATHHEHGVEHGEYEDQIAELEEQIAELETENERLRNEKRLILEQREEHTELVRFAEEQRELDQRRRTREDAPAWTRAKWWLLGRDDAD